VSAVRIATWNVNSVGARLPRLLEWLTLAAPDVLCLQEIKCTSAAFPTEEVGLLGYQVEAYGDGRWNGVALLSRVGICDVQRDLDEQPLFPPDAAAPEARAIGATCGGVRVWSVYVPNGREVDADHYHYKLAWLERLHATAARELPASDRYAILGDFNIAPNDDDVWDRAAFDGMTHVTVPERAAYRSLIDLGLVDLDARALKGDHPYTYWDYRDGAFHKGWGMRIDLVLASPSLAAAKTDAYVDRDARKGKGPSDHAPVVVDI
jgi:exodeoxyribonuclease III